MSTLYEMAQTLKQRLENGGTGVADAYGTLLKELGGDEPTIKRMMAHPNPAAISDYAFACYVTHAEANK